MKGRKTTMIMEGLAKTTADGVKKAATEIDKTSPDKVSSNPERMDNVDDFGRADDTHEVESDSDNKELDESNLEETKTPPGKDIESDVDRYLEQLEDDDIVADNIEHGDELVDRLNDGATDGIFDGVRDNVKAGIIEIMNKGVDTAVDVVTHGIEKGGEIAKAYIDHEVNKQFNPTAKDIISPVIVMEDEENTD